MMIDDDSTDNDIDGTDDNDDDDDTNRFEALESGSSLKGQA